MGILYCGGGCGKEYRNFPADMLIQDDLWKLICPTPWDGKGTGGVLCPNCICERLIDLGMTRVEVIVDATELIKIGGK